MIYSELLALDRTTTNPLPPTPQRAAKADSTTSRHHDTTPSRHHHVTPSGGPSATAALRKAIVPATTPATLISRLRGAVKHLGKEVSTHRFTVEEKERLAELVYRYERRGYRTSENEMVRVAVNWLLQDHAARGKRGVLHRTVRALHE